MKAMGEGRPVLAEGLVGPGIIEGGRVKRGTPDISGVKLLELSIILVL